jgi:hypothetical protein
MKTRVKTGKLVVLLLTLMTLICLPLIAFAEEGGNTIKVTMTISYKGILGTAADGSAMVEKEVTVTDIDGNGQFTYDEALVAAHKAYYSDGESGYATSMGEWGLSVDKMWGEVTDPPHNYMFFTNGAPISTNVGEALVADGEALYAAVMAASSGCDFKSSFDFHDILTTAGQEVSMMVTGFIGMEGGEAKPLPGIQIGYWKDGKFVEFSGAKTNDKGVATFTVTEEGTFLVTATGEGTGYVSWMGGDVTAPIMAPYGFLTVKPAEKVSIKDAAVTVASATYSGKALTPAVTVKLGSTTLKKDTDYTVAYTNNTNAGTGTATITGKGNYIDSVAKTFTINKASQTVKVKAKTFKIKKSKVAKKKQTIAAKKVTKSNSAKTKITYSLQKANKSKKKFKVASSGKITVAKGLKKGTYKLTIKAAAAADKNYKAASKTFKVTITVK